MAETPAAPVADASPGDAGVPPDGLNPSSEAFPQVTGLTAHRLLEGIGLRLAPALAAGAIAYTHIDSGWEASLVFACVLAVSVLLRHPRYPLHLIPIASAVLYLLAPVLGAMLAVGITALDQYASAQLSVSDVVAPVLGAWAVTGLGVWLKHSFAADREIRVAVIGSRQFADGLQRELEAIGVRGYRVVGWIDPDGSWGGRNGTASVPRLGSLVRLRDAVISHGVELLVLGPLMPASEAKRPEEAGFERPGVSRLDVFERTADACLDLPVSLIEAGQLYEELFGHVPLGTTNSAWFQHILHPRYRGASGFSKRVLDLALGAVAAVIAAPVVLVAALAVKLADGGPMLHRQMRIGERGRRLELIKLRTMRPGAELEGEPWTSSGDARVTPVGRVLRRLHIDELPQLWLVLKGEMSLVGPRPEQASLVGELESRFGYYDRRHLAKPGITGWAQVRCGYGGSSIGCAWKLCHDLYYLKRRSSLFDLLIICETLSTVFRAEPLKRPDERFIIAPVPDELVGELKV